MLRRIQCSRSVPALHDQSLCVVSFSLPSLAIIKVSESQFLPLSTAVCPMEELFLSFYILLLIITQSIGV